MYLQDTRIVKKCENKFVCIAFRLRVWGKCDKATARSSVLIYYIYFIGYFDAVNFVEAYFGIILGIDFLVRARVFKLFIQLRRARIMLIC